MLLLMAVLKLALFMTVMAGRYEKYTQPIMVTQSIIHTESTASMFIIMNGIMKLESRLAINKKRYQMISERRTRIFYDF